MRLRLLVGPAVGMSVDENVVTLLQDRQLLFDPKDDRDGMATMLCNRWIAGDRVSDKMAWSDDEKRTSANNEATMLNDAGSSS